MTTQMMGMTFPAKQAGRLADPTMAPNTDPRIDPRLLAALEELGMDTAAALPAVDRHTSAEKLTEVVGQAHIAFNDLYETLPNELPGDEDTAVTCQTEIITGANDNDITLRTFRPRGVDRPVPGIVYFHGGGMAILEADNKVHRRWCQDLAATGLVVVGVEFRNAYSATRLSPFPAGLNDCASAVAWLHARREQLGITRIVLQGESGGANLALASVLRAKRDGYLDAIDGVYATVPYISGGYGWDDRRKLAELPSLVENDRYFTSCGIMDLLTAMYDPSGENAENPYCWPYSATEKDLAELPPHVVVVNELDPLRDEGMAYYRKLAGAGVSVVGRVNLGLVHAADMIFRQAIPDVYRGTVHDIKRFVDNLETGR